MTTTEAIAKLDEMHQQAIQIGNIADVIKAQERIILNLRSDIHAVHGLLAPLGGQPIPSVIAIREALRILKVAS
jgi:hypothetical protein